MTTERRHVPEINRLVTRDPTFHDNVILDYEYNQTNDGYDIFRNIVSNRPAGHYFRTDASRNIWEAWVGERPSLAPGHPAASRYNNRWVRFGSFQARAGYGSNDSYFYYSGIKTEASKVLAHNGELIYVQPNTGIVIDEAGRTGPATGNNPGTRDHSWNHATRRVSGGTFHYWNNPADIPEVLYPLELLDIPWGPQPKVRDLLNIPWEHTQLLTRRLLNIPWVAPDDTLRANNLLHIEWGEPAIPVVRELLNIPWTLEPKELRVRHLLNIPWAMNEGLTEVVRPRVYCFGEQRGYPKVLRDQDKVKAGTPEAYHTLGIKWFNPLKSRGPLLKIEWHNPSVLEKVENGFYDN